MHDTDSWEEVTATVKHQADIVQIIGEHVNLKRSGVRYLGLCPFHGEKTPSFSVHPGQQFYYCFGCGAAGDVFSFIMNFHNVEFRDALKTLAQRLNIELPERKKSAQEQEREKRLKRMFALNHKVARIYQSFLEQASGASRAREYLAQRGIGEAILKEYCIGYAPAPALEGWNFLGDQLDEAERSIAVELGLLAKREKGGTYDRFRDRVMFPIFDPRGRVAGFGGRILGEGNPKYLNSPESSVYSKSHLLFGLYHQRDAIRSQRRAVLVEGNFDLLALVAQGFDTVVAPLGTALTREQVRQLKPLADEIFLLFDGDEAGIKAAERAAPIFMAEQIGAKVALLPDEHDPDTFVRQRGAQELKKIFNEAETLPEFLLARMIERHGVTLDGKARIIAELGPLLDAATSALQRSVMAAHFGELLGVAPEALLSQLTKDGDIKAQHRRSAVAPPPVNSRKYLAGPLKSLVGYMLMNPARLPALEEAGIQQVLGGTIGEVIYLQLKLLLDRQQGQVQPEDLLTSLPEGEERVLVADLLLAPANPGGQNGVDDEVDELPDIVLWLRRTLLKQQSDQLMTDIGEAQKTNDFKSISNLMQEKMRIDAQLKEF